MKAGGERSHTVPVFGKGSPREHASLIVAGRGAISACPFLRRVRLSLGQAVTRAASVLRPSSWQAPFTGNNEKGVGQSENTSGPEASEARGNEG